MMDFPLTSHDTLATNKTVQWAQTDTDTHTHKPNVPIKPHKKCTLWSRKVKRTVHLFLNGRHVKPLWSKQRMLPP